MNKLGAQITLAVLVALGLCAVGSGIAKSKSNISCSNVTLTPFESKFEVAASEDLGVAPTQACKPERQISEYMGSYHVVSIDKYGGSLSSEIEAKKRIGGKVVLTVESFKSMWNAVEIQRPKYAMSCYPAQAVEGEVQAAQWGSHWSNFYGFGTERSAINVLEIHGVATAMGEPEYWYEVVLVNGKKQLWNMYDGWLYKLEKFDAEQPTDMQVKSVGPGELPDKEALKQLVGGVTTNASMQLLNYPELPISDRISQGFQAARRALTTMDGWVINWGFKYQEANLQSVAISDAAGRLELVAVVDDVLDMVSIQGTDRYSSVAEYQRMVKRIGLAPHVVLVARDQAALKATYPLFKSWMQANLLGFNTSCAEHATACALMPSIEVRTEAYLSSGKDAAPVKTDLPQLNAAPIAPEAFTQ